MPALTPTAAAIAGERVGTNKLTEKLLYGFDHCNVLGCDHES
jgi:hypothetical protein